MSFKRIASSVLVTIVAVSTAFAGIPGATSPVVRKEAANQVQKIEEAIRVLEEMMKESDKSIPVGLIETCAGIAIIPDVIRAGLVIGGRHGKGVLLLRTEAGGWTDPSFIDIKGGSIGWQAGVQSADVILVFRTPRSVEKITEGDFTLGADVGVAAGPLGRTAEASTNSELKAEILSYSRSRGLYAGLTFQGSSIQEDRKANRAFYGSDISPKDIFAGKAATAPEVAAKLKAALAEVLKK
ncbi:MAG: lipid-binding SYLF domain-containing protein [Candidatus Aminicenantes bacterium]|nr:lipid-binding SYLF domain-containing protein [Candidatus Aminicenantes bacterium]